MSDCRRFESLLESWITGSLPDAARREAETHLASCPECCELCALARLGDGNANLTATVVAATVGSACARAEAQLPAYVTAELPGLDRRLVALHLESCPDCDRLAGILAAMDASLPRLAELPVPAALTREILTTLRALGGQSIAQIGRSGEPFDARLTRWWRVAWPRLIRRPRFATEIAYALTVVAVLAVQAAGTFAGAAAREWLERVREETVVQVQAMADAPVVDGTSRSAHRLGERFEELSAALHRTAGTFLHAAASSLQEPDEPESSTSTKETP